MQLLYQIVKGEVPGLRDTSGWSDECIDFIAQCFTRNAADRPTADQLLQHPFIGSAKGESFLKDFAAPIVELLEEYGEHKAMVVAKERREALSLQKSARKTGAD